MSNLSMVRNTVARSRQAPSTKTAAYTIKSTDNNGIIVAGAVDLTFTLPSSTFPGFQVTCYVGTASASTGLTVDAPTGHTIVTGSKTSGQDLVNTAATDAVGDLLTLRYSGDTDKKWYVVAKVGTWA